jgi:hypothetical protein
MLFAAITTTPNDSFGFEKFGSSTDVPSTILVNEMNEENTRRVVETIGNNMLPQGGGQMSRVTN